MDEKDLAEMFDAPEDEEENKFNLPAIRPSAQLPKLVEPADKEENAKIDSDAEYARNNLYEITEISMNAIKELASLSREMMHPRTYEVLATLVSSTSKMNLEILELAKTKREAKGQGKAEPAPITNNIDKAIFVGTSDELLDMLEAKANGK